MPNIRVLVHDAPNMLRDILEHAISREPDMEVVPEPAGDETAAPAPPDVLVVGAANADAADRGRALLGRWPRSRVLMITARGHKVVLYELVPRCRDLGELSPGELVKAIRSAARPGGTSRAD